MKYKLAKDKPHAMESISNNAGKRIMAYENHGTEIPKSIKSPHKAKRLARSIVRGLRYYLISGASVDELDSILGRKLGAPPNKSELLRAEDKGYAKGFQDGKASK